MSDAPKANTPWTISTATLAEATMSIVRATVDFVSADKYAPSGMKRRTLPAMLPNANLLPPDEPLNR